jgi:PAS domain S-box-containing protein
MEDAVFIYDLEGNYRVVNQRAADMTGYTITELLTKQAVDVVAPEAHDEYRDILARLMRGEQIAPYERRLVRKDGSTLWSEIYPALIRDRNGKPLYYQGIVRDISRRKRVEIAALEHHARYRLLVDHFPNGMVALIDRELCYTLVGGTEMARHNLDQTDLIGHSIYQLYPAETADQIAAAIRASFEGHTITIEVVLYDSDYQLVSTPLHDGVGEIDLVMIVVQNITERKRAETALIAERTLLQTLIDTIPDYIYVKDTDLRFVQVNQAVITFLELPPADILGKTDADFWDAALAQGFAEVEQELLRTGKPIRNIEQYTSGHGGKAVWLETSKAPLYAADGTLIGLVGIGRDITELKQAQARIRESQERLALFVEQCPVAFTERDLDWNVISWNPAAERLFGYTRAQAMTELGGDFMLLEGMSEYRKAQIRQMLEGREGYTIVNQNRTRDGRILTCEWVVVPVISSAGTLISIVSMAIDITQRIQAEEALKHERDFIKAVFSAVDALVMVMDKDLRLIYMNRAAEQSSGYRLEEVRGTIFEDNLLPEDADHVRHLLHEVAQTQQPQRDAHFWRRRDGEQRWVEWSNTVMTDAEGSVVYLIGTGIDATERHSLEQRNFELSLERERAHLMRGLLRDISHDLRTPLSVLHTGLYLLRQYRDREAIERRIDLLEENVQILSTMINQVFVMSDLDSTDELHLQNAEVERVLQEVEPALAMLARSKGVTLHYQLEGSGVLLSLNSLQFSLAVTNIVKNAIQHTPEGGVVSVRTWLEEKQFVVEIEDTGSGIAPADIPFIFDRFYRSDKARPIASGSTGLGLAIARKIVVMHNGTIEVASEVGRGSTFTIRLPL